MLHETPLIATIVGGLGLAFVFGAIAHRFRFPPLVGYLFAGIAVGPFTPGFVADQGLASELAELGVILLMFGVGLHFSLEDLLSVRAIALPGAIVQIAIATFLGFGLALLMGWTVGAALVFGIALSVASTVVLLRAVHAAKLFGVSLALGAFFAGMILSESPFSQRAAQESLPLRDAFAVLFFVSVGMLFDPATVWREPWLLAATLFIIIIGKSFAALLIVLAFRYSLATALRYRRVSPKCGEFSFILAELGVALNLLPKEGRDLILAGAIISILLNR